MDTSLFAFALLSLAVVVTPGPTVLLALSNGSRFGFAAAGYGIFGAALSDAVLISATAFGLGAVMTTSALWFDVVKWIGVAYLLWLGLQMTRSSSEVTPISTTVDPLIQGTCARPSVIFRKSFLVAVTNPKGYLFFAAFLPQFISPISPLAQQYAILAFVFIVVDVTVMFAYAGLGTNAVKFLNNHAALWIDRVCGGVLIALGSALALLRHSDV